MAAKNLDGSLWWDSFSDLLLLLDSMLREELTSPDEENNVASQVRAALPWLLRSTACFLPPTAAAREALNSPILDIGGHVLEVTAAVRTLSLQASAALHLDAVQTFLLVSRLVRGGGPVSVQQVGVAYSEERLSLLQCTRALVGLPPEGPSSLAQECASLEDGRLLDTTLDLLPGGTGDEVWVQLDVLFLLLYHNPCSPATFERLLDCFQTHLLPPASLTTLRLSAQAGVETVGGLRQKALLVLLEALDLDSLLLHLMHPHTAPPHPFQEAHLLRLDASVGQVGAPESAPLLLAWAALGCLSASSIPHAHHLQAAVEGGGLPYLLALQSSPLFLDSSGSAPVEGYHSVLKSLMAALLAAYQGGPTDSLLSILCSAYRGAPSLCLQLWDRSSSTDQPVRQLLLTTSLPSPALLRLLAALAQGQWPASCVYAFLCDRGLLLPLLLTQAAVCSRGSGGEEEWEMVEGVVEVVEGMVGGSADLIPLLLGMDEFDVLAFMVSVLCCPRLRATHTSALQVLAASASCCPARVAQAALGHLLPALQHGGAGVIGGVLDVCTALLNKGVRSLPLLRVVDHCHLLAMPLPPGAQWQLGGKLYSLLCAAAVECVEEEEGEGGVWVSFRASLSLPPSFPLLLSNGAQALQDGECCEHLEAALGSALSLLTLLLNHNKGGWGGQRGVAEAVLPLATFHCSRWVQECALRALCALMAGGQWTLADASAEGSLGKVLGEALSLPTAARHPSLFASALDLLTAAAHHRPLLLQPLLHPTSPTLAALRTHLEAASEGWGSWPQRLSRVLTLLLLLGERVPHLLSPHSWSWSNLCAPLRLLQQPGGEEAEAQLQCESLLLRLLLQAAFCQQQAGEAKGVLQAVGEWGAGSEWSPAPRITHCASRCVEAALLWAALLGFCAGRLEQAWRQRVVAPCLPPLARAMGRAGRGEDMGGLACSLLLIVRLMAGAAGEAVLEGCLVGLRRCLVGLQEEGEQWRSAQRSLQGLLLLLLSGRKGCGTVASLLPSLCQGGGHLLLPILNAALNDHLPHSLWAGIVGKHLPLPPLLAQLRQQGWQGAETESFLTLACSLAATPSGAAMLHSHSLLSLLPQMAHAVGKSRAAFCPSWDEPAAVDGVAQWGKCLAVAAAMARSGGGGEDERLMDFIGTQRERMLTALQPPPTPPPAAPSSQLVYTTLPALTAVGQVAMVLAAGAVLGERRVSLFSAQTAHLLAFLSHPRTLSCPPQSGEEKRAAQQAPPLVAQSGWFGVAAGGSGGSSLYSHAVGLAVHRLTLSLLHFHALLALPALPRGMEREGRVELPDLPAPRVLHGLQDQGLEALAEVGAREPAACLVLLGVVERAVFLETCLGTAYGMRPSPVRQEAFAKALHKVASGLESLYPQQVGQIRETARVVYKGL